MLRVEAGLRFHLDVDNNGTQRDGSINNCQWTILNARLSDTKNCQTGCINHIRRTKRNMLRKNSGINNLHIPCTETRNFSLC